jgi:hypothetical protein
MNYLMIVSNVSDHMMSKSKEIKSGCDRKWPNLRYSFSGGIKENQE